MISKRNRKLIPLALLALFVGLMIPTLAYAGGWAVITLDQLPGQVIAGQPYELGFVVRQHGETFWQADQIIIEAAQVETGQNITFTALPDSQPGHYKAELLFPEPGVWKWGIASGLFPSLQPMPALQVLDANAAMPVAASAPSSVGSFFQTFSGLRALALLPTAAILGVIALGFKRRLPVLAASALIVIFGSLAFVCISSASTAQARADQVVEATSVASSGQQLFLAKGCVVCHTNTRAGAEPGDYIVGVGPNLSAYHNDPDYLRGFLADPSKVKPGTQMPNLGLSTEEIDALVSFINAD